MRVAVGTQLRHFGGDQPAVVGDPRDENFRRVVQDLIVQFEGFAVSGDKLIVMLLDRGPSK